MIVLSLLIAAFVIFVLVTRRRRTCPGTEGPASRCEAAWPA